MRCLYYCFCDSDYRKVNDGVGTFPLKFCSTHWLEDVPSAKRAIAMWPKVVKYVDETNKLPRCKMPSCDSYADVNEFVQDPFVLAKMNFFIIIAKVLILFLEPFGLTVK